MLPNVPPALHEIRNPLGSIRLGVSMLRDSVTDKDALNTIDIVERGIQHLNKLVVDVTQFSRQKALEPATVDLHVAFLSNDQVAQSFRFGAGRNCDRSGVASRRLCDHIPGVTNRYE